MLRLSSILLAVTGLMIGTAAAAQDSAPAAQAPAPAAEAPAQPAAQPPAAQPPADTAAPPAAPAAHAPAVTGRHGRIQATVTSHDLPFAPAPPPLTPENTWNLDLSTGGRVVIQLRPDVTPQTVERIKTLTHQGFYNGLAFFRVIDGFMAQGGDPHNNGTGGSTLPDLQAEIRGLNHLRGSVAMARAADPNSANSQFYIMFTAQLPMDRDYTVFGRVVSGMSFVDAIERGEPPVAPSRIIRASLGTDNLPEMSAEQLRAAAAQLASAAPPPPPAVGPGGQAVGPAAPAAPAAPRQLEPVRAPGAPPSRPRNPNPN